MSEDSEIGKRQIEEIVLDQLLDTLPILTGRAVTNEWEGDAQRVDGSPDHIIGLDGQPFGVELTEIRGAEDAQGYVDEAYRLASKKSEKLDRATGCFSLSDHPRNVLRRAPLFEIRRSLEATAFQPDFEALGFAAYSGPPIQRRLLQFRRSAPDQPICFA